MSSSLRHNHNNVPKLHVPQTASKFPFSSPISDDQLSNRSFESKRTASSSDLAGSPHSSQNPFGDTESGNTSGQDEFHLERYSESSSWTKTGSSKHSSEKPSKESQQARDASLERRKKPGLNVITDFSKSIKHVQLDNPTINQVPACRPRFGKENGIPITGSQTSIMTVGQEGRLANTGFVNLSDLEGLRKNKKKEVRSKTRKGEKKVEPTPAQAKEDESNGGNAGRFRDRRLWELSRKESFKPSKGNKSNLPRHLQAPEQNMYEVSPTARSVIFGISVPENEVEAHKPGDEISSALTLQTPITPTIVVTPADATVGWPQSITQDSLMRKPPSSIYSQAAGAVYHHDADAPPVPSLPDHHKKSVPGKLERPRRSIDSWETNTPRADRPFSSETVIDEDDARPVETGPLSAGSKDEILPSSCDTGRPRSKGWWNLMLSPMLSRAGTNATKKTVSPMEETPALPCLSATNEKGPGLGEQTSMSAFSPETPRRAGLETARNSTWSDWTQWEHDREQQRQASKEALEGANDVKTNILPHQKSEQCAQVMVDASARKLGLAAEYFQACAFDLLNDVPYFECTNHDCGKALPKLGAFDKVDMLGGAGKNSHDSGAGLPMDKDMTESSSPLGETRLRSDSDSTIIEDDPIELSPNVREAHARPFLKATQPPKIDLSPPNAPEEKGEDKKVAHLAEDAGASAPKSATPPPYSPPPAKPNIPRYIGFMPPSHQALPSSPGPLSPQAQGAMNPSGGIAMSQIYRPAPTFININSTYPADLPPRPGGAPVTLSDIENPVEARQKAETRRRRLEQEDAVAHKAGGLWRGRGCIPQNGCFGRGGSAGRTRRRWYFAIATGLVLMIVLSVVLATQLTRRGDQTPVQSQWLNLTGYPPMPTGISTIARPDRATVVTACVQPSSLWSCAVPREDQASISPSDSDQPNFRLEIRFRNGTVEANGTIPVTNSNDRRATRARRAVALKRQNDPFTNSLFEPNPAPPSLAEQMFLGNTTDNITVPFSGEVTPFFITFLTSDPTLPDTFNDTDQPSSRRVRRQNGPSSGSIPSPALLPDGTAAPANLLPNNPLPYSQPVMLYNRGLDTEHYGFYSYFDRSIFIKTTDQFNSSSSATESRDYSDPDNSNGGATKLEADLRCTWAQTRFLVRIWTNPNFAGQLLPSANGTGNSSGPANGPQSGNPTPENSSATDFNRPGSFPYPVTVTLDRHGGDSSKKGVYCYGMDGQQKIVVSERRLVAERRGAGGTLINGAPGIFSNAAGDDGFDPGAGGVDGGTGGCGCEWRNWAGNGGQ